VAGQSALRQTRKAPPRSVLPLRRTQSRELGGLCRGQARNSPERPGASAVHRMNTNIRGRGQSFLESAATEEEEEQAVGGAGVAGPGFLRGGGPYAGCAVEGRGRCSWEGASRGCTRTASPSPLSTQGSQQAPQEEEAQEAQERCAAGEVRPLRGSPLR